MVTTIIVPHNVLVTAVARVVSTTCEDGEWYKTDGVEDEDVVTAYAAKGAASYVASLVNLANPGTYDCVGTGHAPDWDAVNGWKFDGLSQYLDTGITDNPLLNGYSFILKFSHNISGGYFCGMDNYLRSPAQRFFVAAGFLPDSFYYSSGNTQIQVLSSAENGIIGIAGLQGYMNGTPQGASNTGTWSFSDGAQFLLGCIDYLGDSPSGFSSIYIQAFALYNIELTQSQIQAIGNAMP